VRIITNLSTLIIFLLVTTSCYTYKDLKITKFNEVKPIELSASKIRIQLNLEIENPNNYSIAIKEQEVNAFINQHDVGKVYIEETIKLPSHSKQNYVFTLVPDASKIMPILPSLFFSKSIQGALKGNVKIKAGLINKKIDIDLTHQFNPQDFGL
jgi:LEA14-like dessication related protein